MSPRRRRWLRITLIAAAVLVLLRVAIAVAIPIALRRVAASNGLACAWDEISLSLHSGELEIRDLDLWPALKEGVPADAPAEPPIHLEYARFSVDLLSLVRGPIVVRRAEVDGLDVVAERAPGGDWMLAQCVDLSPASAPSPPPQPPPAKPASAPAKREADPITLAPPVRVESARLQHVRARVIDATASPALDARLDLSLRLSDLGSPKRPARFDLVATSPGLVEVFRVEGRLDGDARRIEARLDVEAAGLRPAPLARYLAPIGIAPHAETLGFSLSAELNASVAGEAGDRVHAQLTIHDAHTVADGVPSVAVDEISVTLDPLTRDSARATLVAARGVRAAVERLPSGALRVAGVDLAPVAGAPAAPPESRPLAEPAAPFPWEVDRLHGSDFALAFHDRAVSPDVKLALVLDDLDVTHVVCDPQRPGEAADLALTVRALGVAERTTIRGTVVPFAPRKRFDLALQSAGVAPRALDPYLSASGIECDFAAGTVALHASGELQTDEHGRIEANIAVDGLEIRDGDDDRLRVHRLALEGVVVDPAAALLRVGEITVANASVSVRRDAAGSLHAVGVHTVPPTPRAPALADVASSAPAAAAASPPRIEIGSVSWTGTWISFVDETFDPPSKLSLDDLGLEIHQFGIGGAAAGEATTLQLRAWSSAPDLAERVEAAGTIAIRPGPLDVALQLALDAKGLRCDRLRPYLSNAGVEARFGAASLHAAIDASVKGEPGGVAANVALRDVAFEDGGASLASMKSLRVDGVHLAGSDVRVGSVEIVEPHLSVARDADGALLALGLRLPRAGASVPVVTSTPPIEPPASREAPPAASSPTPSSGGAAPTLTIDRVRVGGAAIDWRDAAVDPPVAARFAATVESDHVAFGPGAGPIPFAVHLGAADALDDLALAGTVALSPGGARLELTADARRMRSGPFASYLPPGIRCDLADGRVHVAALAEVAPAADGGLAARLELRGLELRDGDAQAPLLAMDSFVARAARIDVEAGVLAIDELSTSGLQFDARRSADGAIHALGVAIVPTSEPKHALEPVNASASRAARTRLTLPTVTLDKLDVGVARFSFLDESRPGAAPLVATLRVANGQPLRLLDRDPATLTPIGLRVTGAASPVVHDFAADVSLEPFEREPQMDLRFEARGLRGEGVTEAFPALAEQLDGRDLKDGVLTATLHVRANLSRRAVTDFDVSRGFGLNASLEKVELRSESGGELLAGLDGVDLDLRHFDPATGDVDIRSLEIRTPRARFRAAADGLHAFGFLMKPLLAPATTSPAAAIETAPASAPAAAVSAAKSPDVRVDHFSIRGIDVVVRDDTTVPPVVLPFDALDVEVKRFTTRAFSEPHTIRFDTFLSAGKVDLPKRIKSSGFFSDLAGAATAAVSVVGGAADANERESRAALGEFAMSGRLEFVPALTGNVRVSVSTFELLSVAGPAKRTGVVIGDGTLDSSITAVFKGNEGATIDGHATFTSLSLSEPPGGPISQYLALPAPLAQVLYLLRNSEGEHRIPLSFHVPSNGIGSGAITNAAISSISKVIANAVARAPFRVAKGLTSIVEVSGDKMPRAGAWVRFEPGSAALPPSVARDLEPLIEELRSDSNLVAVIEHRLSTADVARAQVVANPSPRACEEIAASLRQRRAELLRRRDERGAEARARFGMGMGESEDATAATDRIRGLDLQIALTESALDEVLDHLRAGAERSDEKRTRIASLGLSRQRLSEVHRALAASGVENAAERIEERAPRYEVLVVDGPGEVVVSARAR